MYFSGLIVLVFVAICHSMSLKGLSRQKRVIGGDQYEEGQYPFHASLWYMGDDNPYTANTPNLHHTCGGSLVGDRWVLTSGACFDDAFVTGMGDASMWRVYLGMYAQTDAKDQAQHRRIQKIFKVPGHNFTEMYGDIALLKLDKPATLDKRVGLVRVNGDPDCPKDGQDATVLGWGQTQNQTYGLGSDVPHEAIVNVFNLQECRDIYGSPEMVKIGYGDLRIDDGNLCAGNTEGGVGSCYGDSGSPLLAACGTDSRVIVGTASFGYGCAKSDFPAVNTRVSVYKDWIVHTMENNS